MNTKTLRNCALIVSAWGSAGAAHASGLGIADFDWEVFDNAGGSVTITETEINIVGGDMGVGGTTMVSTTVITDLEVAFDWAWHTLDGGGFDQGFYHINGEEMIIANDPTIRPITGTDMFTVSAGDTFGFGVHTLDGVFGAGFLDITHIKAVPSPSSAAAFALFGLATACRRRRLDCSVTRTVAG